MFKEAYPRKKWIFYRYWLVYREKRLQIGTDMLLIVTSMTLNNPEPLKKICSEFFAIFGCNAYFNTELRRNDWR